MSSFSRTDTSTISKWWWTIDHWLLIAFSLIIAAGILLTLSASPAVAERIGLDNFYFVKRQFMLLPLALIIMLSISFMNLQQVQIFGFTLFGLTILLLIATLLLGLEIKGARRWIYLGGFSLQPSEWIKPAFAVITAWVLARQKNIPNFPGQKISLGLTALVCALLLAQPDLGMTLVITAIWFGQLFLTGLSIIWIIALGLTGITGVTLAYFTLPHVASRIDRFMDPASGDTYQVTKSLEAFVNGGLFGRGPGEGTIKEYIPDVHSDFIFAVAGEEFGIFACLLIVALFAFVVLRGFSRSVQSDNLFVMLAVAGLLIQFGVQAFINMASTLSLIPTKGMTLPFISYGGSSLLGIAVNTGFILALTRKKLKK